MTNLVERLREPIIADAYERRTITSGALAERLIRERLDAADELSALRAERAALKDDAERYRWLTNGKRGDWVWNYVLTDDQQSLGNNIDEVIDAVLAALKGEPK